MSRMIIFEPAMCCSTGVCGPSVDPQLLRVSTTINRLKNMGIAVERYNLSNAPQMFIRYREINRILNEKGVGVLPITMVDGVIVKTKSYPTNKEFSKLLGVPEDSLRNNSNKSSSGCGCKDGRC